MWFLGDNDGLTADGVNRHQGTKSSTAFVAIVWAYQLVVPRRAAGAS